MSTIITAATTPNSGGVSRTDLFKQLALDTGLLLTGTVTGGDAETLIDTTQLKTAQGSPSEWIGGWVRIAKDANGAAAAPENDIRPISDYIPEIGYIKAEPNFSATPESGDFYELWKINPTIVLNQLDQCLTKDIYVPCWTVLSEVADYDMEQSHTTDWTAGGSATVSKQSAAPRLSSSGTQYLRVVSGATGDYARSNLLRVEPGRTYHVSAVARCSAASTTAKLVTYDETNGAVIESKTSNRLYPARIWYTFRAPSTCHSISIRLTNVESGVTTEWDEVVFYSLNSSDIPLPWWVRDEDQVKGVFELLPDSIGENLWDATLRGEEDQRYDTIPNFGGNVRFSARARQGYLHWPVFIFGARNETAYSNNNTDLKYVNIDLLCACLKYKLYRFHSQPLVTGLLDSENFLRMLGPVEQEWMQKSQSFAVSLPKTLNSPTPWAYFNNPRFSYGEQ